jgi:hypothetical protein
LFFVEITEFALYSFTGGMCEREEVKLSIDLLIDGQQFFFGIKKAINAPGQIDHADTENEVRFSPRRQDFFYRQ